LGFYGKSPVVRVAPYTLHFKFTKGGSVAIICSKCKKIKRYSVIIIAIVICCGYKNQLHSAVLEVNVGKIGLSYPDRIIAEVFPFEFAPFGDNFFSVGIIPYKFKSIPGTHRGVHSIFTNLAFNYYPFKWVSKKAWHFDGSWADIGLFSKYEFAYSLGKDTSDSPQSQLFMHNIEIGLKLDLLAVLMPGLKCGYRLSFVNDAEIANRNHSCFFLAATVAFGAKEFSGYTHDKQVQKIAACEKVRDAQVLKTIAQKDPDPKVRLCAVSKLTSQVDLFDILKNDNDITVRLQAIKNISNVAMLEELALGYTSWLEAKTAVEQIEDQATLGKIAINATNDSVRIFAASKISTQFVAKVVIETAPDNAVRLKALQVLDSTALQTVLDQNSNDEVAIAALKKIGDPYIYLKTAQVHRSTAVKIAAIEYEKNEGYKKLIDAGASIQTLTEYFLLLLNNKCDPLSISDKIFPNQHSLEVLLAAIEIKKDEIKLPTEIFYSMDKLGPEELFKILLLTKWDKLVDRTFPIAIQMHSVKQNVLKKCDSKLYKNATSFSFGGSGGPKFNGITSNQYMYPKERSRVASIKNINVFKSIKSVICADTLSNSLWNTIENIGYTINLFRDQSTEKTNTIYYDYIVNKLINLRGDEMSVPVPGETCIETEVVEDVKCVLHLQKNLK
jgi:hypothetical protein